MLPRVHGSALFERGETQILGVTTLNMLRMEQMIDTLNPERTKRYMHNYNMPPYSTGETGRVGSPKRREIGHGALAERALIPVLPAREEFPYAIRQVSEAIGSNGSTSMGSVCASTMSLLDAGRAAQGHGGRHRHGPDQRGRPVRHPHRHPRRRGRVRRHGLQGRRHHATSSPPSSWTPSWTASPPRCSPPRSSRPRAARLTILDVMREAIDAPAEMSPYAPRIITIKVPVDKIGEVIGPKGKMINSIQEDTGAEITIEDDGTIYIGATDGPSAEAARKATINAIANPHIPEVGERFLGTVVKTTTFGAFVSLLPGKDGLLHITQIRKLHGGARIENIDDVVKVGDKIQVEIREVDDRGKLSLVPVEVVEREAAAAAAARDGGRRRTLRRPRRSDRDDRDRSGGGQGGDGDGHRTRHRERRRREAVTGCTDPADGDAAVRRTVLPGGLRVITEHLPAVRSAAFGIWAGVGSRDEDPAHAGATHYLEHLLFKGTSQRTALEISAAHGRGRRRAERVHRQGVHLLLRAGARRRPAAGHRRPVRHGDQLADRAEGRGRPSAA